MADVKIKYSSATAITKTVASTTSSATFIAGTEIAHIDNTTTLYDDILLSGIITTHASSAPTVDTNILIYAFAPQNGITTWPDAMDGTSTAADGRSITSVHCGGGFLKLAAVMTVTAVAAIDYPYGPVSLAQLFGGVLPARIGLWLTHNTGQTLNATETNHTVNYVGVTYTVE